MKKFDRVFGSDEGIKGCCVSKENIKFAKEIASKFKNVEYTYFIGGLYVFTLVDTKDRYVKFSVSNDKAYVSVDNYDEHFPEILVRYDEDIIKKITDDGIEDDEIIVAMKGEKYGDDEIYYDYNRAYELVVMKKSKMEEMKKNGYKEHTFFSLSILVRDGEEVDY
jgi:hypothetical protein